MAEIVASAKEHQTSTSGPTKNLVDFDDPITLMRFVKTMHVKLWLSEIKGGAQYHLVLWAGNMQISEAKSDVAAADTNQASFLGVDLKIDQYSILDDRLDKMTLNVSIDPKLKPSAIPLIEVTAGLSDGATILVVPRTAKPATIDNVVANWDWNLQKDPFQRVTRSSDFGNGDTSYSISVGASFDFISKLNIDKMYYSANVFAPKLWWSVLGLDAGIYEYRNISRDQGDEYVDIYKALVKPDSSFYSKKYSTQVTRQTDNLGLFFNPTYSLGGGIYLYGNLEIRRRITTETTEYSISSVDSSNARSTGVTYSDRPNEKYAKETVSQSSSNEILIGLGFLTKFEDQNILFDVSNSFTSDLMGRWNILIEFELIEKTSHIKLGGEVRSIGAFRTDANKDYVIYLAKEFPMSAITDFFAGKK
jgi:hypothetical protein